MIYRASTHALRHIAIGGMRQASRGETGHDINAIAGLNFPLLPRRLHNIALSSVCEWLKGISHLSEFGLRIIAKHFWE